MREILRLIALALLYIVATGWRISIYHGHLVPAMPLWWFWFFGHEIPLALFVWYLHDTPWFVKKRNGHKK